uniref:Uncharacterized protein n=1 Tax=uncultured Thiotrichaceae bacterium TaxID=298394 RepID=A0A6S6SP17_9GAMM|nr:MAG: Unknown protein [uncultured Thiotrichaceae bacterium]
MRAEGMTFWNGELTDHSVGLINYKNNKEHASEYVRPK